MSRNPHWTDLLLRDRSGHIIDPFSRDSMAKLDVFRTNGAAPLSFVDRKDITPENVDWTGFVASYRLFYPSD